MDPQPTCPQPAPPSPLPLALKLFVLFASCFSFGAGVGLTLWIIPDHSLAHIYRVVSHGAHIAISTTVATPCEASAQVPCEDPKPQPSPDATDQEKPHTPEVVTPEQPVPVEKVPEKEEPRKKAAVVQQKKKDARPIHPCDASSYTPAGPIAVHVSDPGFHVVTDPPNHYRVFGASIEEVLHSLDTCKPIRGDYYATTNWWYSYVYDYYQKDNGLCGLRNIAVGVHFTSLLPYWDDEGPSVKKEWNRFLEHVIVHEDGHTEITTNALKAVYDALDHLPDTDCRTIVSAANERASLLAKEVDALNTAYDQRTNHGETQGARFPN